MKCLILAGGKGERLWPLSRGNFPKQFIQIQKNHSLFQETVARNLPYCDEFIVLTNWEYRHIIANQMGAFQGVSYRCVFEEEPRKTTAPILLACMDLQPSEYVYVVAADHLVGSEGYKEALLKAKDKAREESIVLFGLRSDAIESRYGYIAEGRLYEKPYGVEKQKLEKREVFQNLGMILFQNGLFLHEMKHLQEEIYKSCKAAYDKREALPEGMLYQTKTLKQVPAIAIERSLLEKTNRLSCVEVTFSWNDIGSLEDLNKTQYEANGVGVISEGVDSTILNQSPRQAVVLNGLDDVLVVNTTDAVYVGRKGASDQLKGILHDHEELHAYSDVGAILYRSWGFREKLVEEEDYRVQRITILPGKTIYEHRHERRTESWTIIQGTARIVLDGAAKIYTRNETATAKAGVVHQISNNGNQELVFIETAVGEVLNPDIHAWKNDAVTETELGLKLEPVIKLSPAFKDSLWGGTKLRDLYGKECDYDVIAESWELSAHPAGNSIIASGRHKGLSFSRYLETVGKEVLGWKCAPLQAFPILIKFIDAEQNLSVQVHPDDDYALEHENDYGKNEMWYVIDSEPGAGLYVGFNRDVDREEVKRRIEDNSILDILNYYPTKPGDVFFIPAGTVHAIGAGNLICEVQQSSNTTYRLYDYDRRDRFGNPRELHLDKALSVLDYKKYVPGGMETSGEMIRSKYFEASIVDGEQTVLTEDDSFHSIICFSGEGELRVGPERQRIRAGDCFFLPAAKETIGLSGQLKAAVIKV